MTMLNALAAVQGGLQARETAFQGQAQEGYRNALTEFGMNAPETRTAFAAVNPVAANALNMQDQQRRDQMIGQVARTLAGMPADVQARMYPQFASQLKASGVQLGQFEQYPGPEAIQTAAALYALPAAERTEFERMIAALPEDQRGQAIAVRLGLAPDANTTTRTNNRSPLVTVNTGDAVDPRPVTANPPPGFQRRWDETAQTWRDEPIPGSKVAGEADSAATKLELASAAYDRKFSMLDDGITKAIGMLDENGRWVAGVGSLLSGIPESASRDFAAQVEFIKSNLGFEELQQMRDNSPTGGALGQVTERELAFLQAAQGNLDAAQSPAQLRQVLVDIQRRRREFAEERRRIMGGEEQPAAPTSGVGDLSDDDLRELLGLQ